MGKGTSQTTQQSQSTQQLTPWAPAGAALTGILGQLGPAIGDISGGPLTAAGIGQLAANAGNPNPLGPLAMNAASSLLGGGANYGKAADLLTSAYGKTAAALSPYTSGSALDPTSNPALAQELATVRQDVTNSVNPMFAAAGRLGSPDNYQALARGIAQGEGGILQNAASNQLNAIGMAGNAAGSAASGLTGADVANAGILGSGIGNAATAYGAQNLAPQALIAAGTLPQQIALQNAGAATGILGPLAGMFGTQTGNSSSQGTQTMSPLQQMWGWMNAGGNLFHSLMPKGFGG
jgi:hypothetical protein